MTARTFFLGDWSRWIRDPIDAVRALLAAIAVGCLIAGDTNAATLLGGAAALPWFDTVTHFSLPFFLAPTLDIALARADVVPDPKDEAHVRHYVGMVVVTFALGVALGGVWEIREWVSDHTFGSSLQLGLDDTVGDLVAGTAGSLLLVCWARYGWGSVRRVPGENRYEATEAG